MKVVQANCTLLIGGVPWRTVSLRDLIVAESSHARRTINGRVTLTLECVAADEFFQPLWYDIVHHQDALDRWADDGGANAG